MDFRLTDTIFYRERVLVKNSLSSPTQNGTLRVLDKSSIDLNGVSGEGVCAQALGLKV